MNEVNGKPVRFLELFDLVIICAQSIKLKQYLGTEGVIASMPVIFVLDLRSITASWVATVFTALFS